MAVPVTPASGPLTTEKLTAVLGRPAKPLPSSNVAVSVTGPPLKAVAVVGPRVRVAFKPPGAAMGRHCTDSLCLGEHDPASMPPVSSTWVLSTNVMGTPAMVIVTVGATVSDVHVLGWLLVSKLS